MESGQLSRLGYGVRFQARAGDFFLLHNVTTGSGVHPAFCTMVTGPVSSELKRQVREADNSPPSSREVEICGSIPPLPYMLHIIVLII
jgi:hypothetical protein